MNIHTDQHLVVKGFHISAEGFHSPLHRVWPAIVCTDDMSCQQTFAKL